MPITIVETSISDVKIIQGKRFYDERGFFSETFKESEYLEAGLPKFVQDNLSESSKGVIRGLHWQDKPHSQGKLVTCFSGAIRDIAVDIRPESSTFGKIVEVLLEDSEPISLWIPEGFAHGFQALANNTRVLYKVTNYWNRESEKSLNPLDESLNINWDLTDPILSAKDQEAQSWLEYLSRLS